MEDSMNQAQQELYDFMVVKYKEHMEEMGVSARINVRGLMTEAPFYDEVCAGKSFRSCTPLAEECVEGFIIFSLITSMDHHLHQRGILKEDESLIAKLLPKELRDIMESDDAPEVKVKKLEALREGKQSELRDLHRKMEAREAAQEVSSLPKTSENGLQHGLNVLKTLHKAEGFEPHRN